MPDPRDYTLRRDDAIQGVMDEFFADAKLVRKTLEDEIYVQTGPGNLITLKHLLTDEVLYEQEWED